MSDHEHRWTLGRIQNPVRGMLHGSAAVVSVFAAIVLLWHASGGVSRTVALLVFGFGLVFLYTVSTLYHTVPWRDMAKKRMQQLDHSTIFVFIAASYTPFLVIVLDGWMQWASLLGVWGITAAGIMQLTLFPQRTTGPAIAIKMTLGWLAVLIVWPILQRLPWTAVALLGLGGVFYTIGMIFLVTNRPRLWPRVFSYHELFHVLVIAGTLVHFTAIFRYVARFAPA
jgi:hemolysin III